MGKLGKIHHPVGVVVISREQAFRSGCTQIDAVVPQRRVQLATFNVAAVVDVKAVESLHDAHGHAQQSSRALR